MLGGVTFIRGRGVVPPDAMTRRAGAASTVVPGNLIDIRAVRNSEPTAGRGYDGSPHGSTREGRITRFIASLKGNPPGIIITRGRRGSSRHRPPKVNPTHAFQRLSGIVIKVLRGFKGSKPRRQVNLLGYPSFHDRSPLRIQQ